MINNLENIKLKHNNSDIYSNVDGLSLQNIFYVTYSSFPSCYLFENNQRTHSDYRFDTKEVLEYFSNNTEKFGKPDIVQYYNKVFGEDEENKSTMAFCAIFKECGLFLRLDETPSDTYILFKNQDIDKVNEMVEFLETFYKKPKIDNQCYYRLASRNGGFYLEKGKIKEPKDFNVDMLYNDSFKKEHIKIKDFIENEEKSGLIMLHGLKGTGKSTYIKHLVTSNKDKKFVYVPANMINLLGEPSFGSFLTTLNNHIIVLEDCENVIRDRQSLTGMSSAVSMLLNMTDGILSDDLNIKFICTFNEDMKNIDSALLRKGRLISKYEFTNLETNKTNKLLKHLGIDFVSNKPLSLAEIFHFNDDDYEIKKKTII